MAHLNEGYNKVSVKQYAYAYTNLPKDLFLSLKRKIKSFMSPQNTRHPLVKISILFFLGIGHKQAGNHF